MATRERMDELRGHEHYLQGALVAAVKFHYTDCQRARAIARDRKATKYDRWYAEKRLAFSEGMLLGTLYAIADVDAERAQIFAQWARERSAA